MDILTTKEFLERLQKRHDNKEITLEQVGYKVLCYHNFCKTYKRVFNIITSH